MRELDELINVSDPAWPHLLELLASSATPVEVLPGDAAEGHRALQQMQVTARSALGGLVLNSGGLVVDHGWVRVFGGGSAGRGMPSLAEVNQFPVGFDPTWHPAAGLVVGHDVVGGVFALNGHDPAAVGRPGEPGQMTYFAPDTLAWEAMEMGHSGWLSWLFSGRLERFYDGLRWPAWREEAAALAFTQGITVYPFLWSKEARADLGATRRRPVPMREVLGVAADFARQMGSADPGFLGEV
ncbi:DUF2625 family protein [Streptacidiphilus fuscans]|uniref:DUF2625 family protein n=1 Tax=Streptacidiphilus fuscans TaxID=2789292 RepID=A0A931B347_9ACTN|nr:DUF2625 family protein [Streptacidiphilus fuscans]MBF9067103.1 DUF2625 family protein [Streptacidiphilus fuscans]